MPARLFHVTGSHMVYTASNITLLLPRNATSLHTQCRMLHDGAMATLSDYDLKQ